MPVATTGFLALGFMSPASRGIDAADRDDFTVSFPGYCGRLCCSPFAESHRRSSRRKKVYFLVDCVLIPWNCLRYPYNISELSLISREAIALVQFLSPCILSFWPFGFAF